MRSPSFTPVVSTWKSTYARLKPVGVGEARLTSGLLHERFQTNITASIPAGWEQLRESHTIPNFYVVSGRRPGEVKGLRFIDSDGYKWLEGACWAFAHTKDSTLKAWIDEFVDVIEAAQEEDGYVNTHFMGERKALRFTDLDHAHAILLWASHTGSHCAPPRDGRGQTAERRATICGPAVSLVRTRGQMGGVRAPRSRDGARRTVPRDWRTTLFGARIAHD
jgi:hypothetical protein